MKILELDRINQLAAKNRSEGLTAAERAERDTLRQSYLVQMRAQMDGHLNAMTIIDPIGNNVTPLKLWARQAAAKLNAGAIAISG